MLFAASAVVLVLAQHVDRVTDVKPRVSKMEVGGVSCSLLITTIKSVQALVGI